MYIKKISFAIIVSLATLSSIRFGAVFAQTPQTAPKQIPSSEPSTDIVYFPPKTFFCGSRDRKDNKGKIIQKQVPTTIIETDRGEIVVYYWIGTIYSNPIETGLTRCSRVASILDSFNRQKQLNLIKIGEMNKKTTICASNNSSSPCSKLIFTIEPNEKPANVLKDLHLAIKGLPIRIVPITTSLLRGLGSEVSVQSDSNSKNRGSNPEASVREEILLNERNGADLR